MPLELVKAEPARERTARDLPILTIDKLVVITVTMLICYNALHFN